VVVAALLAAALWALPLSPQPAPPFPKIVTDAPVFWDVAPGISYGDYQMLTDDGPLSVDVIAVDLRDPSIRVGSALANEHLVSDGETVSSMAHRLGAVAGINGDYFDINQTNQPLNILVQDGRLERMPMRRWALAFDANKTPLFSEFQITAQAVLQQGTIALKTINDWPPPGGGAVLITPAYGALHSVPNVTEYTLQLTTGTPPFATYRVAGIADNAATQPAGYYLAIGPQAYGSVPLPNTGDAISVQGSSTPALDGILTAIGGGPLLVKDGAWYADPDGPNKGEFLTHMPASAAGVTREGTLLLFEVDGRQPALSIGVLQPQLAQLMIAFGVVSGMQFDGGGSSTIVARLPGDTDAVVQNSPSDGDERRVGDALLIYSDAPQGPPAKIATRPQVLRALPGAQVPFSVALTDAAGHRANFCTCDVRMRVIPADAGHIVADRFIAADRPQDAVVRIDVNGLHADLPVHITDSVARAQILPLHPALRAGESLDLAARAYDAQGYPIAIPRELEWSASDAAIDPAGHLVVRDRDARVGVRLGNRVFSETVVVGEHTQAIDLDAATFATAPRGGPGSVQPAQPCPECTTLSYDFSGTERAAYLETSMVLPERALALSAEVEGDGNGEILRVALNNAINERFLYTIAKVDWRGWRHVEFRIPAALPQPLTLRALYVINRVGPGTPVTAAGSVAIRNLAVVLAGGADNSAK
jgi:exopolysaccharide biosynthesis protein